MKLYEIIIICILALVLLLLFYVVYSRRFRVPKLEAPANNAWEERAIERALKPAVDDVVKADERLKVAQENKLAFEEKKTPPPDVPKRSVAEIYAEIEAKGVLEAENRKIKSAELAAQRKAQYDIELARIQAEEAEASKNADLAKKRYKASLEIAGPVVPYNPLAEIDSTINRMTDDTRAATADTRIAALKKELKRDGLVFQGGK